jgi:hypothetical protein
MVEYVGLQVGLLHPENKQSQELLNWLEEVCNALSKGYLKTLMFGIFANESNQPLECYYFDVSLDNDAIQQEMEHQGKPFFFQKKRDSEVQCTILIRLLLSMTSTLKPLPAQRHLGFVLECTNVTPANYELAHFRAVTDDDNLFFNVEPISMHLGKFKNPFLKMDFLMKSITDFMKKGKLQHYSSEKFPVFDSNDGDAPGTESSSGQQSLATYVKRITTAPVPNTSPKATSVPDTQEGPSKRRSDTQWSAPKVYGVWNALFNYI